MRSLQCRYQHNHAILTLLWHAQFRVRSFISICRFTVTEGIQNCSAGSAPVPAAALPEPAAATSRGAARPSSPPAPAAASFKLAVAAAASADACFAATVQWAARPPRPCQARSLASPLWTTSSPWPSPQEAPAAATPCALVCVAVVDLFFAAAVLAGGARRSQVYVGIAGVEILQRGSCRKHIR